MRQILTFCIALLGFVLVAIMAVMLLTPVIRLAVPEWTLEASFYCGLGSGIGAGFINAFLIAKEV